MGYPARYGLGAIKFGIRPDEEHLISAVLLPRGHTGAKEVDLRKPYALSAADELHVSRHSHIGG